VKSFTCAAFDGPIYLIAVLNHRNTRKARLYFGNRNCSVDFPTYVRTIFTSDSIQEVKALPVQARTIQPSSINFTVGFVLGGIAVAAIMLSSRRVLRAARSTFGSPQETFPTDPDGDVEEMVEHNWQGF